MKRLLAGVLCCTLFAPVAGLAAPAAPTAAADPLVAAQRAMDERTAHAPGTGIIIGYVDGGTVRILTSGSSGTGRPLDEHTRFEIGSVTKTLTANVLAQDVLAGRVKLGDPVAKYLPASVHVPSYHGMPITLLSLATQHSGLPRMPDNVPDVTGPNPYADYTLSELYAFLNGYTLTRAPGVSYEYSNLGVGLLGQALANQAHETYAQLVRSRVFAPLGMTESTVAVKPEHDAALAVGHDTTGAPTHSWEFQALAGAGAVRSTMHDMLLYLRCNMGSGPLARVCLFTHVPRATFPRGRIGLVWMTSPRGVVWHDGDTAGFHAVIAISADRRSGVVALSNGPPVADIGLSLLGAAKVAQCPAPQAPVPNAPYDGTYCAANLGIGFLVAIKGASLTVQIPGQPAFSLQSTAADHYVIPSVGAAIEFVRRSGAVVGLILQQNGQTIDAPRLGENGNPMTAHLEPVFPPVVHLGAATLAQYAGTYDAGSGLLFTVKLGDGGLSVMLAGQPFVPVYASAKDEFFYKIVDAQITFTRDASGRVTGLVLHQNGQQLTASKK